MNFSIEVELDDKNVTISASIARNLTEVEKLLIKTTANSLMKRLSVGGPRLQPIVAPNSWEGITSKKEAK